MDDVGQAKTADEDKIFRRDGSQPLYNNRGRQ